MMDAIVKKGKEIPSKERLRSQLRAIIRSHGQVAGAPAVFGGQQDFLIIEKTRHTQQDLRAHWTRRPWVRSVVRGFRVQNQASDVRHDSVGDDSALGLSAKRDSNITFQFFHNPSPKHSNCHQFPSGLNKRSLTSLIPPKAFSLTESATGSSLTTSRTPQLCSRYGEEKYSLINDLDKRWDREGRGNSVLVSETRLPPGDLNPQAGATVNHSTPQQSPSKTHKLENFPTTARSLSNFLQRSSFSSPAYLSNEVDQFKDLTLSSMPSDSASNTSPPAQHKPLVVGRTKPQIPTPRTMDSSSTGAANKTIPTEVKESLNHEIASNLKSNTSSAAPADSEPQQSSQPTKKKEKAPKQPKQPKATPAAAAPAPLSPALIDLRVGHILRAIAHPNADSLFVSTIAMGDIEGTEHTSIDEETGKVVRTVCSGLNGLVPLEEMQGRKVVVVANLKPVNMRSIKSAAMVLAASPKQEEGADPHAPDRVVELVNPPEDAEAGDKVFFEGWEYGEGKGPEKQLNPKKKQWEAIQPGFFTGDDLSVGFNAGSTEVDGEAKGVLVVQGKGKCTVKSLKGAVVR